MNDFEAQWQKLSSTGYSGGRLRVYPDHILNFFIDFSLSGKRELIIESEVTQFYFPELPTFENLELVVKPIQNGFCIGVTLIDSELAKSFSVMCYDIAERSKRGITADTASMIVIESLRDWSNLLKRKGKFGLTRNEVIGLWGELNSLEELLYSNLKNQNQIIYGWRGPNGDQRDIGFNQNRIEVKTQLSTRALSLKISSLDQLDEKDEQLKIILNRVSPSDAGSNLMMKIERITNFLSSERGAFLEFERKIALAGFEEHLEVCKELFALDEILIYEVGKNFPRLTHLNVPYGIKKAEYEIAGSAIESYRITWNQLIEDLHE
jgi:hypothetical protein